jgi:hypothetical protein
MLSLPPPRKRPNPLIRSKLVPDRGSRKRMAAKIGENPESTWLTNFSSSSAVFRLTFSSTAVMTSSFVSGTIALRMAAASIFDGSKSGVSLLTTTWLTMKPSLSASS